MGAGAGDAAGWPSVRGIPERRRRERGLPSEPSAQAPATRPGGRACEASRRGGGVSGVLGVDEDALARWIGSLCALTGPLTVARVGLGQSNLTYRVSDAAGQAWVVRRPPAG